MEDMLASDWMVWAANHVGPLAIIVGILGVGACIAPVKARAVFAVPLVAVVLFIAAMVWHFVALYMQRN